MKIIGVRQSLEEEKGFGMCTGTFVHTTKSNIQAVDKHLIRKELLICAAVQEVSNKYAWYVNYYESNLKEEKINDNKKNIYINCNLKGRNFFLKI